MRGLLDTSVIVALETGRPVGVLGEENAVSVITVEELALGVLMAEARADEEVAAGRRRTLAVVTRRFEALPVTRAVALASAEIRGTGRERGVRYTPLDALICATAAVHGLTLYTQDAELRDVPGVDVQLV